MLELLVDNIDGTVWDIGELVTDVSWKTSRIGKPGRFTFSYVKDADFKINSGDVVRVRDKGYKVFYGYVFSCSQSRDDEISVTCYDQLRYLNANDTVVLKNTTATQVLRKIAADFELKTGPLIDTLYKIPALVESDKKLFDIVCKALDLTLINTGKLYFLYDDFGQLMIQDTQNMLLDIIVGDESLAYDFKYKRSIDEDTYVKVKIVQDNKKSGHRDLYIVQDSATRAQWGQLQLYRVAEENMNSAQIKQQLNQLLELKNRESKSLQIDALGDIRVRAGCYVHIILEELGLKQPFLVDECTHKNIGSPDHTMSLDLKVV